MALAANRPCAFRMLVATPAAARKIGLSSMIRVSSTVCCSPASSKLTNAGTRTGAAIATRIASTSSTASTSVVTVEATRHARASWSWACSPDTIGTRAADRAPAATSWNIRSGSRNAAKK